MAEANYGQWFSDLGSRLTGAVNWGAALASPGSFVAGAAGGLRGDIETGIKGAAGAVSSVTGVQNPFANGSKARPVAFTTNEPKEGDHATPYTINVTLDEIDPKTGQRKILLNQKPELYADTLGKHNPQRWEHFTAENIARGKVQSEQRSDARAEGAAVKAHERQQEIIQLQDKLARGRASEAEKARLEELKLTHKNLIDQIGKQTEGQEKITTLTHKLTGQREDANRTWQGDQNDRDRQQRKDEFEDTHGLDVRRVDLAEAQAKDNFNFSKAYLNLSAQQMANQQANDERDYRMLLFTLIGKGLSQLGGGLG